MPIMGLLFLRQATNRYEALAAIEADKKAGKMPGREPVAGDFAKRRALMLPKAAVFDEIIKAPKDKSMGAALTTVMDTVEASIPAAGRSASRGLREIRQRTSRPHDAYVRHRGFTKGFGRCFRAHLRDFLAEFSKQGAHDNGEFFTPPSIVQTIVNVIEPNRGVILDPACGSGGLQRSRARRPNANL